MKKITKVTDLDLDRRNANRGSVRGTAALEESITRYGAGRSVLADKHGRIIAGNTTTEVYVGMGMEDVIVVPTDGSKLVVVQRTDLDLERDKAARELAHADNRINQIGYTPDVNMIEADMVAGADLGWLWRNDEIEAMKGVAPPLEGSEIDAIQNMDKLPRSDRSEYELTVVCESQARLDEARRLLQDNGFYTK